MSSKKYSELNLPAPSLVHIRLYDEDGELLPQGGATYAYLLKLVDGQLIADVGIAVCSDLDNFNKRIGASIAVERLARHLTESPDDDELWFSMSYSLATQSMLVNMGVTPTILQDVPTGGQYVTVMTDELAYQDELTQAVKAYITRVRTETYFGSNDDVQEEIDNRFGVEDTDIEVDEDEEDTVESDSER